MAFGDFTIVPKLESAKPKYTKGNYNFKNPMLKAGENFGIFKPAEFKTTAEKPAEVKTEAEQPEVEAFTYDKDNGALA